MFATTESHLYGLLRRPIWRFVVAFIFTFSLFPVFLFPAPAEAENTSVLDWVVSVGGTGYDITNAVQELSTGDLIVTGTFSDTADLDPGAGVDNHVSNGDWDVFVMKLDKDDGTRAWVKTFGSDAKDRTMAFGAYIDGSDNIYLAIRFQGDGIDFDPGAGTDIHNAYFANNYNTGIVKLDSNGDYVWARVWDQQIMDLRSLDSDGTDIFLGGLFWETGVGIDFDPTGGTDVHYVQKTQASYGAGANLISIDTDGNYNYGYDWGGGEADVTTAAAVGTTTTADPHSGAGVGVDSTTTDLVPNTGGWTDGAAGPYAIDDSPASYLTGCGGGACDYASDVDPDWFYFDVGIEDTSEMVLEFDLEVDANAADIEIEIGSAEGTTAYIPATEFVADGAPDYVTGIYYSVFDFEFDQISQGEWYIDIYDYSGDGGAQMTNITISFPNTTSSATRDMTHTVATQPDILVAQVHYRQDGVDQMQGINVSTAGGGYYLPMNLGCRFDDLDGYETEIWYIDYGAPYDADLTFIFGGDAEPDAYLAVSGINNVVSVDDFVCNGSDGSWDTSPTLTFSGTNTSQMVLGIANTYSGGNTLTEPGGTTEMYNAVSVNSLVSGVYKAADDTTTTLTWSGVISWPWSTAGILIQGAGTPTQVEEAVLTHTATSGTNELLVATAHYYAPTGSENLYGVYWNSYAQSFTKVCRSIDNGIATEIWYLTNPAVGTNSANYGWNTWVESATISMTNYTGVNTASPINNYACSNGTGTTPTVTVTGSVLGDTTFAATTVASSGVSTLTDNGSSSVAMTEYYNILKSDALTSAGAYTTWDGTGPTSKTVSNTTTWTTDASTSYSAAAININGVDVTVNTDTFVDGIVVDSTNNYVYLSGGFCGDSTDMNGTVGTDSTDLATTASQTKATDYCKAQDGFISQYTTAGAYGWTRTVGTGGVQFLSEPAVDSSGNVYVTGGHLDEGVPEGVTSSSFDMDPTAGTDAVTTVTQTDQDLGDDGFVISLTSAGAYRWSRYLGGAGYEGVDSVYVADDGDVFFGGWFSGTRDFDFTSSGHEYSEFTAVGDTDAYLVKVDQNGVLGWVVTYGGDSDDRTERYAVDALFGMYVVGDESYVTGRLQGTMDFDSRFGATVELTSAGDSDAYIANYRDTEIAAILALNAGLDVEEPTLGITDMEIKTEEAVGAGRNVRLKSSGGTVIAEVETDMADNRTWSGVTAGTDTLNGAAFTSGLTAAPGTAATHTLYIPKVGGALAPYICPNATSLGEVSLGCSGGYEASSFTEVNIGGTEYFVVTGLTGTGGLGTAGFQQLNPLELTLTPNYSAISTTTEVVITWTSSAEFASGDKIAIDFDTGGTFVLDNCTTADTDADNDGGADGAGIATTNGGASNDRFLYTFNAATTQASTSGISLCVSVTSPATAGNYQVDVYDENDGFASALYYVGNENQVNITADVDTVFTFVIRNSDDDADQANVDGLAVGPNLCDLGNLTNAGVQECSYRLKVTTNASGGYVVNFASDGSLRNSDDSEFIDNVTEDTTVTANTEGYGIAFVGGSCTEGTLTESGDFNDDDTPTATAVTTGINTSLYSCDNANNPTSTDTTNTALVTHRAEADSGTPAGSYTQLITYTVTATF